ncbi:esterase/lipase family protein [Pseudosporangium ferrugineum]|uniref:Triacylglycerol lipase n=1 Tax=Pseudosporangium ferrugineum TaxID=439699 RepID=A0A2T0RHE6_9ACTN|nr:alpha/beta fold hydrolase [Pseudosporangium ferrugineum]PRY20551.1 triacylglycerol lipase [Pseudosporangium ferrugineum]
MHLALSAVLGLAMLAAPPSAPRAAAEPVVLVHGWEGSPANMSAMRDAFVAAGHPTYVIDLPGEENVANATAIAGLVGRVRAETGAPAVHLVGHSMGGLSARYFIKRLGGAEVVLTYVSMGTAQNGYLPACLLPLDAGGQMCPSSEFLRDLNEGDDTPGPTAYSTFRSSQESARNVHLDGGACFLVVPGVVHSDQPKSPPFIEAALAAVAGTCPGTYVDDPVR